MVLQYSESTLTNSVPGVTRRILACGNRMMSVETSFAKGAVSAMHAHTQEQISYIISGVFQYETEHETIILTKGDSFYVAPHVKHSVTALEDGVLLDVFTPQRSEFISS